MRNLSGILINRETLEIRKSISDVLNMTVDEAVPFFEMIPKIHRKVKNYSRCRFRYITLGQQSTTLVGKPNIKLAGELSKRILKYLFIFWTSPQMDSI
jgi:excinuclease ABC subunit A